MNLFLADPAPQPNWGGSAKEILETSGAIFPVVQRVFALIGVVIVLWTLFKAIQAFVSGSVGKSARTIVGGLVAAILAFNIMLPVQLVKAGGNVMESVICTLGSALNPDESCSTSATPAP